MTPSTKRLLFALFIPPQCVILFVQLASLLQFGRLTALDRFDYWLLWVALVNVFCLVPGLLLYGLFELVASKGLSGSIRLLVMMAIAMVVGGATGFAFDESLYSEGSTHPSFLSIHLYLLAGLTAGAITGLITSMDDRPKRESH